MAIANPLNRIDYTGDGTTTTFAYAFNIYTQSDLVVYITSSAGVVTTQILNSNYTQSAVNVPGGIVGGSIVFTVAPASGSTITLIRTASVTQGTSFTNLDKFDAKTAVEGTYDRGVMISQQLSEAITRSIRVPVQENRDMTLPSSANRANGYLSFNAAGNISIVSSLTGSGASVLASGSTTTRLFADRFAEWKNVKDYGAAGDGVTNDTAAFTAAGVGPGATQVYIPPGNYLLSTTPTPVGTVTWFIPNGVTFTGAGSLPNQHIIKIGPYPSTWVNSVSSGVYEYLETASALNIRSKSDAIGIFSPVRSSSGSGAVGTANIGISAFAYNDSSGTSPSVWGFYSTVLRKSATTGYTHGMEIDVGNAGSLVSLYPNSLPQAGQTDGLWIASGGETSANTQLGTVSCALCIVRNDSNASPTALFDKGIIFHAKAIAGTDGATGNGVAIALAKGHQLIWYNNSNQAVAEVVSNTGTISNALRLDLNDAGLLVQDRASGGTNFQVQNTTNSANYLTALGAVAGSVPQLVANGSDANIDLLINAKGTGDIKWGKALVGLGPGAAPTFGTIGGSGPATAAQNSWMRVKDSTGAAFWVPAWK